MSTVEYGWLLDQVLTRIAQTQPLDRPHRAVIAPTFSHRAAKRCRHGSPARETVADRRVSATLPQPATILAFIAANSSSVMSPWVFMSPSFCNCAIGSSPPAAAGAGGGGGAA